MKKDFKKRLLSLLLTLSVIVTMSGCRDNKKKDNEPVGYLVESDYYDYESGLYSYIVDRSGLESTEHDFGDSKCFAKEIYHEEYGTNVANAMTTAFYRDNLCLVIPDDYKHYNPNWFNFENFASEVEVQYLHECAGITIKVVKSNVIVKRNLSDAGMAKDCKFLHKGDTLSSIAIFYGDELVAYRQYGAGSDCGNVIAAQVGDPEVALKSVSIEMNLDSTQVVEYSSLCSLQEEFNQSAKLTLNN